MDIPIKQRLVGLAVLIALAAIFLPMLLDGSGREGHVRVDMDIPPEPLFPAPERLPERPTAPEPVERSLPAEAPAPVQASEPAPAPAETARPRPAEPVARATPSAPAERGEAVTEEGWVVQVGSFSEEGRAQTLRKSLREKGFEAFVEPFSSGEIHVYRVKVGPPAARADAEGLAVRLEQEQGLKGLVVSQP
ncbi:MAG: SPOR domain-containing protein [Chromatiales bacterium]|nr:SPOR domain-containing protein [Chromatiales bacterium]